MIIKPFNITFFILIALMIGLIFLVYFLFRNKSEKVKTIFYLILGGFNLLFFTFYKWNLSKDTDFNFNIYNELPFQLCNINMFIIPLGVLLKKDGLKGFGFYLGTLGALLALSSPEPAFTNNSIFLMRNLGFYGTHMIIIIMAVSLVTLGLFKPSYKKTTRSIVFTIILSLFILVFNLILGKISQSDVNYFFIMHPAGISVLEIVYNIVPIPYIYILPYFLIIIGLEFLITLPFEKKKHK